MRLASAYPVLRCLPFALGLVLSGCINSLIDATIRGDTERVRSLLNQGLPVDQPDRGSTPLMAAAREGRLEIAEQLLDKGAQVDARDRLGHTPLHHAVIKRHADIATLLIKRRANVNAKDNGAMTPLMWAAKKGDAQLVRELVDAGALLEEQSAQVWDFPPGTALMFAAHAGHLEAVKALLTAGANTEASGRKNAAYWARVEGHREIAQLLKARQAELAEARDVADDLKKNQQLRELVKAEVREAATGGVPKAAIRSDVDEPNYRFPENAQAFAVVVGVETYADLPSAQYAARDAEAVTRHLLALGYPRRNIITLTESRAVHSALRAYLEKWLPAKVNEASTVLVYFSGHGSPDVVSQQAYLLPWDGKPEFLEETAYPLKSLYEALNTLKAKRVVVVLDACFSGFGARSVLPLGLRPLVNRIERPDPGKVIVISAANDRQAAGTVNEHAHGALTYYFLKGLNGSAKDAAGNITLRSLYDYLSPKVQDAARARNRDQTPVIWPESGEPVQTALGK